MISSVSSPKKPFVKDYFLFSTRGIGYFLLAEFYNDAYSLLNSFFEGMAFCFSFSSLESSSSSSIGSPYSTNTFWDSILRRPYERVRDVCGDYP